MRKYEITWKPTPDGDKRIAVQRHPNFESAFAMTEIKKSYPNAVCVSVKDLNKPQPTESDKRRTNLIIAILFFLTIAPLTAGGVALLHYSGVEFSAFKSSGYRSSNPRIECLQIIQRYTAEGRFILREGEKFRPNHSLMLRARDQMVTCRSMMKSIMEQNPNLRNQLTTQQIADVDSVLHGFIPSVQQLYRH